MSIFCHLLPELQFYVSGMVARNAARTLADSGTPMPVSDRTALHEAREALDNAMRGDDEDERHRTARNMVQAAKNALNADVEAGLKQTWWGAAARGRDVLPLLVNFPERVRDAAMAMLATGDYPRPTSAAIERYMH